MNRMALLFFLIPILGQSETLAFIGSPTSASASDIKCSELLPEQDDGTVAICMNRVFVIDYEVIEAFIGVENGETREFFGSYHYSGLPDYTLFEPAFVVIDRINGRLVLQRIDYAEKRDDKWWVCENWSDDD